MTSRGVRDVTLSHLAKEGVIVRLVRGVYGIPIFSKLLGQPVLPSVDEIAKAIARKYGWRIFPSGDSAANGSGFGTQIPALSV